MLQRTPGRRGAGRSLALPIARVPPRDELDPDLVMGWIARHTAKLPATRTVIQFDCRAPKRRYWLVLEPEDVSVCREAPGFDADVLVEADAEQLYALYFGRTTLSDSAIAVHGAPRGEVDSWFAWSTYAPAVRV